MNFGSSTSQAMKKGLQRWSFSTINSKMVFRVVLLNRPIDILFDEWLIKTSPQFALLDIPSFILPPPGLSSTREDLDSSEEIPQVRFRGTLQSFAGLSLIDALVVRSWFPNDLYLVLWFLWFLSGF